MKHNYYHAHTTILQPLELDEEFDAYTFLLITTSTFVVDRRP